MPFALLYTAFALVLDLLHAMTRRQQDLAVEVVVLRHQVRMYQRQAQRAPLSWPVNSSGAILRHSDLASARVARRMDSGQDSPTAGPCLPILALNAVLPKVRAGTAGHAALVGGVMVLYALRFVFSR